MDRTITFDEKPNRELFLVEGKSAASTIRQAMNRQTQDVFALQGKVINVHTATQAKVESNSICSALFALLGCGIKESCEPSLLRYLRVVLLTDPDVDGAHARALLAGLFSRFLAPLVQDQRVLAVIPPLWRVALSNQSQPEYAWTNEELEQLRGGSAVSVPESEGASIEAQTLSAQTTRFRGVAQFTGEECVRLMLDPASRRQVRLSLGEQ